uniref:Dynein intermediate chain n=1 Tax=Echinococcus granulosus TaxID=6210 RepID=A0A068WP83_ECHGR|nr:Dynein intermediate chain [Echinococcus granulosus]
MAQSLWDLAIKQSRLKAESSISAALEQSRSQVNRDSRKGKSNHTWQKINANHPDRGLMTVFPVPLTIIGSKYDMFLVPLQRLTNSLQTRLILL